MAHMQPSRVLIFALILPWLAAAATAAETLIGVSAAHQCFEYASQGSASPRRAVDTCTRAIESEPLSSRDLAATYSNRGILQAQRGRYAQAVQDYDRALAINPILVHAMINRANAYTRMRQFKEALTDYDIAAFYSEGNNDLVFYNRALLFLQMGRVEHARNDLLRALETQPDSLRYREALAALK
ncbi:MAG: tetratricopeptide repeat protein [Gammaproteobacteria bacterium]|nr:tetratricopeptide repeat protein [Gammaproteobacteria bacterium]